jgi:hypothetical protein
MNDDGRRAGGARETRNVRMTMMQQRQRWLYCNGRRPSTILGEINESSQARQRGREQTEGRSTAGTARTGSVERRGRAVYQIRDLSF